VTGRRLNSGAPPLRPAGSAIDAAPGIGIDVVEIARLERALERRPGLRERVFSAAEIEQADRHRRPGRRLAARFAAKEAALKALGIGGLRLHEVEVAGGGAEPPSLLLHGEAAALAAEQGVRLAVSLSHEREIAVAVVTAAPLGAPPGDG
jgi:holo-[acyl-carrier protein] synthase